MANSYGQDTRRQVGGGSGGVAEFPQAHEMPSIASLMGSTDLAEAGRLGHKPGDGSAVSWQPRAAQQSETSSSPALTQVLNVVATLQSRLQESESTVQDLQAQVDQLEEKRRALSRKTERSERERDVAMRKGDQIEADARVARLDVAPILQRYMDKEVLREQVQVLDADLKRLGEEHLMYKDELSKGWPRLSDAEDAESQCREAIDELDSAHVEEIAILRAVHEEEMADMRAHHSKCIGDTEANHQEQVAGLRVYSAAELADFQSQLECALWEADVFVREQQDAVREVCIRQRENGRITKQHRESRQEAIELASKLESLRSAVGGTHGREAELQAIRHRCGLLQRTVIEWREALERKHRDCETWRSRTLQKVGADTENADYSVGKQAVSVIGEDSPALGPALPPRRSYQMTEVPALEVSNPSSVDHSPERSLTPLPLEISPWPSVAITDRPSGDWNSCSTIAMQGLDDGLMLMPPPLPSLGHASSPCSSVPTPARTAAHRNKASSRNTVQNRLRRGVQEGGHLDVGHYPTHMSEQHQQHPHHQQHQPHPYQRNPVQQHPHHQQHQQHPHQRLHHQLSHHEQHQQQHQQNQPQHYHWPPEQPHKPRLDQHHHTQHQRQHQLQHNQEQSFGSECHQREKLQNHHHHRDPEFGMSASPKSGYPRIAIDVGLSHGIPIDFKRMHEAGQPKLPGPSPAEEFLVQAIRTSSLQAQAEASSPDSMHFRGVAAPPAQAVQEAENELEMLTFLLGDSDALHAEALLEFEVRNQTSQLMSQKLVLQLDELQRRGPQR